MAPLASPRFSVVIPTLGRTRSLEATLRSVCRDELLGAGSTEVIVVLDGSQESGPSGVSASPSFARLTGRLMVSGRRIGASACRNLGASQALGSFLVFLDDDVELQAGWGRCLDSAISAGFDAVTGRVSTTQVTPLAIAREARYRARYHGLRRGDPVSFFAGGNSVIRTATFEAAGGFPAGGIGSDNHLVPRLVALGSMVAFIPGMTVHHCHDRGWRRAVGNAWSSGAQSRPAAVTRELRRSVSPQAPLSACVNSLLTTIKLWGALSRATKWLP